MTQYEALKKATYLLYFKLGKSIPYERLINMAFGCICYRGYTKVYLIMLKTKDLYETGTYSIKRLEKITLPKKYQNVERTEPINKNCYSAKYSYGYNENAVTYSGQINYDHKVTKEKVIADCHLNIYPWYEVTLLTPMKWTKEFLEKSI